jgi:hypothetical protein
VTGGSACRDRHHAGPGWSVKVARLGGLLERGRVRLIVFGTSKNRLLAMPSMVELPCRLVGGFVVGSGKPGPWAAPRIGETAPLFVGAVAACWGVLVRCLAVA